MGKRLTSTSTTTTTPTGVAIAIAIAPTKGRALLDASKHLVHAEAPHRRVGAWSRMRQAGGVEVGWVISNAGGARASLSVVLVL